MGSQASRGLTATTTSGQDGSPTATKGRADGREIATTTLAHAGRSAVGGGHCGLPEARPARTTKEVSRSGAVPIKTFALFWPTSLTDCT